jgi:hypothetical protein
MPSTTGVSQVATIIGSAWCVREGGPGRTAAAPPSLLQNVATCPDPWSTAVAPGHRGRRDDRERRVTHPRASPSRGARGRALHDSRRWGQDRWPPWPDPAGEAMAFIRRQEHEANREIFCSGGSGFFCIGRNNEECIAKCIAIKRAFLCKMHGTVGGLI